MTGSDDEFEDFLRRRKPRFRAPDDMFEPPAELDRLVLRQAREAIESERPLKIFHGPRWAAPVALAATLLLTVTIILQTGVPPKPAPVPEVTVQNIAERVEMSAAAAPLAPAPSAADQRARDDAPASGVIVELATPMMARRESAHGTSRPAESTAGAPPAVVATPAASTEIPAWRHDPVTWKAQIEKLRNAGDSAAADAELAEFNRQQRSYAVGPDR